MATIDFRKQLSRQITFLENSCCLYDKCQEEAIRIATCLRVMFHTTKSSTSLLTHLNAESSQLHSTVEAIPGQRRWSPLVNMGFVVGLDSPFLATPRLDDGTHRRFISLDEWWCQENVLSASRKANGTRRDLVLWAANKDGGAHVDDFFPDGYQKVLDSFGFSIKYVAEAIDVPESGDLKALATRLIPESEQKAIPLQGLHLATLRQIGHEVLNSPEILKLRSSA
jgi:hypothetical protein